MASASDVVVIEVNSKYNDNLTPGLEKGKSSAERFDKAIEKTKKTIEGLSGKRVDVEVGLKDRATAAVKSIWGGIKGFAGKTFRATMSIVDKATAPLRLIKNTLFSIKGLVAGILTGLAANKLIAGPVALADQIETAQIGFETMMGSAEKATAMMDKIKNFAAKTPFDTSGVISSVQQMMRAGWTAENVMQDMEKIGNAAAAAGQGTEGVQGIVLALQQMRMAGKLNSQDMMQLTNRGVKAWDYVAKAVGKTIPETRALATKGLIPVDQAIQGIIDGMGEYDGMMDKMSNRTVKGLMSNIKDTFDIKAVEKWGKGLAAGATEGLGSFADWLDKIDPMLQRAGFGLYDLGKELSTGFFNVVGNAQERLSKVFQSDEFLDATSMWGKFKVVWDKVISEPFMSWWDGTMKPIIEEKANSFGKTIGTGLSNGIKFLLGMDMSGAIEEGAGIGSSFAQGFLEGFDGGAIKKRLKEIFSDAFQSALKILPGGESPTATSWVSALAMTYLGSKVLSPFAALGRGFNGASVAMTGKNLLPMAVGSAASGKGALGRGAMATIAMGGGNFKNGASMSAGGLSAMGLGSIAGGLIGGGTVISGFNDFRKAYKNEDADEQKAYNARGGIKVGGVAAGAGIGAGIGSFFGGIGAIPGALIGAGIGGLAGIFGGNAAYKSIMKTKYATEEMQKAAQDTTLSAEELEEAFQKACSKDLRNHFGDMTLSMEEMQKYAKKIVFGDKEDAFSKYSEAANQAASALSNLQSSQSSIEKWNWKAGLGIKLDEGDQSALYDSVDTYVNDAKSYIESKHYEFDCAVDVLLDPNSDTRKQIKEQTNDYYAKMQEQLDGLHKDLTASYNLALENDGIIDTDEADAIAKIQQQISDITNKVSQAEYEAKLETIKIKYDGAGLTADNYEQFQKQIQATAQEKADSAETALTATITGLKLQLADETDPVKQEEIKNQIEEAAKGYKAEIDKLQVDVTGFELNTIAESYRTSLDGILPTIQGDTTTKLNTAIKNAIASGDLGKDPMTWDPEQVEKWFGLSSLEEETRNNISEMIKTVAAGIPEQVKSEMKTDESYNIFSDFLKVDEKSMSATTDAAAKTVADSMGTSLTTYLTGPTSAINTVGYGATQEVAKGMAPKGGEFDASAGLVKGEASNALDSIFKGGLQKEVDVNLTLKPHLTNPTINIGGAGTGAATFYVQSDGKKKEGKGHNAHGGMISGGPQLSWLDEEGMGEAVIPFNPARRSRALGLWMETGKKLGVMNHADGGFVGKSLSGMKLKGGSNTESSGSVKSGIKVSIGSIQLEINTSGSQQSLLDMIESQKDEISNQLTEIITKALEDGFENLPLASSGT